MSSAPREPCSFCQQEPLQLSLDLRLQYVLHEEIQRVIDDFTAKAGAGLIMDVNTGAVEAAFRAARVRRMIHGHTHRPAVHELEIDGEPAQRIVLCAWYEQGSYLRCDRGSYDLRELPR